MVHGLVIFDCDGVLVESEHLVTQVESELLATVGVDLSPEQIVVDFVGLSDGEMHRRIEATWSISLPDDFATTKARLIQHALDDRLEPVDGIATLLASLPSPRCVASSSSPERIRRSLTRTGLLEHLDPHLFSASMVANGKPAPDLFLLAAREMATGPDACVVIEDSPHGVVAAVAAGMTAIGFTAAKHCDRGLADRLQAAGAHHLATSSDELADLLAHR